MIIYATRIASRIQSIALILFKVFSYKCAHAFQKLHINRFFFIYGFILLSHKKFCWLFLVPEFIFNKISNSIDRQNSTHLKENRVSFFDNLSVYSCLNSGGLATELAGYFSGGLVETLYLCRLLLRGRKKDFHKKIIQSQCKILEINMQ